MRTLLLLLDLAGTFVFALAGAATVVLGDRLALPPLATAVAGAALCFALRVAAIYRNWHLPKALVQPRTPEVERGTTRAEDCDERSRGG
jgi:uncharacterized membrane protein YeiH